MHQSAGILLLSAVVLAAPSSTTRAQDMPSPFTVVSVRRMAQEAAEAEPIKSRREHTRAIVGETIMRLHQEAAFGTYAEETVRALRQSLYPPEQQKRHEDAKHLFLSGDIKGAELAIGEMDCTYNRCIIFPKQGRQFVYNARFLHLELEAGDLAPALRRLRTTDWKGSEPAMSVFVARAHILAGRQTEITDLLAGIQARFEEAEALGFLADGATIRKLAGAGEAAGAVEIAHNQPDVRRRVKGLTVVAEARAGLPGLPDEALY
jgi:hypothetical protein